MFYNTKIEPFFDMTRHTTGKSMFYNIFLDMHQESTKSWHVFVTNNWQKWQILAVRRPEQWEKVILAAYQAKRRHSLYLIIYRKRTSSFNAALSALNRCFIGETEDPQVLRRVAKGAGNGPMGNRFTIKICAERRWVTNWTTLSDRLKHIQPYTEWYIIPNGIGNHRQWFV